MRSARDRQYTAFFYAKEYAKTYRYYAMMVWLNRASAYCLASPIQMWSLRQIVGPYKYQELNLEKFEMKK